MGVIIFNPAYDQQTLAQYKTSLQAHEHHRELMKFMKNKEYHSELSNKQYIETMRNELTNTRQAIEKSQQAIQQTMEQSSLDIVASNEAIERTFEKGFDMLDDTLHGIETSIDSLHADFNAAMSIVIEQIRISNLLLGNIAELLRIPDSEKERHNYLENAFKHYKNGLFDDALENLLYVEKIKADKGLKEDNYVVLFHIGLLYLYQPELLDVEKAIFYFEQSSKYASAESGENAERLANILAGKPSKERLTDNKPTTSYINKMTSESYYYAAFSSYLQGKFDDSVNYCKKALEFNPDFFEAGFQQAKSLSANNKIDLAVKILEPIIRKEPDYSIKTSVDGDLFTKPEIQNLLIKLRDELVKKAKNEFNKIQQKFREIDKKYDFTTEEIQTKFAKPFHEMSENIQELIDKNTYLDALESIALMKRNKLNEFVNDFDGFKDRLYKLKNAINDFEKKCIKHCYLIPDNLDKTKESINQLKELIKLDYEKVYALLNKLKIKLIFR